MDNARTLDNGVPAAVGVAAMIGFAKAIFEILMGVLGIAIAKSVDDSFGGGVLAFGIIYAIASLLLLRGNRLGYYATVALSVLGIVVAIIYLFNSEDWTFGATLVVVLWNALVLYLLLGRSSAREYFTR